MIARRASGATRRPRFDRWDVAFATVACVAFLAYLYLGRSLTFYHDDWTYLDQRLDGSLETFLRPHNGHWTLVLLAIWKPLLAIFGLTTYVPYLAVNAIANVFLATSLYWLARRLADPATGLVVGALMLSLGAAGELLFHAHGAHLILSTAFGSWALAITIAARPARPGWVAVLLVLGIATGGASLAFLAALVVLLVLDPDRRRDLWSVIPAIVIYAAWFLTFGRENAPVSFTGSLGELKDLVEWMRMGMSAAVGQSVGLTGEFGLVLLCILAVASLWQLLGRGPYLYGAVAALAGLAAQNALTGLARSGMTGSPPDAPRYVHTGAVFAIIAIAVWYGSRPRPRALNSLPLLVIAGAVIAFNIQVVRWWADSWYTPRSEETRAAIDVALEYGGTPALPGDRAPLDPTDPFLVDIPSPDRLREIIAAYGGSPLDDSWQPGAYEVPPDVYERIRSGILGGASPSAAP